jgi:hypothetical protein
MDGKLRTHSKAGYYQNHNSEHIFNIRFRLRLAESNRAPFPPSISSTMGVRNSVSILSPLHKEVLLDNHSSSLDILADFETLEAIIPARRVLAANKSVAVAETTDARDFVTLLDDQEQRASQADSR